MRDDHQTVKRWLSDLIASAIIGAVAALLINLAASWLMPGYWGQPTDWWIMASFGAIGGIGADLRTRIGRKLRKSDKSA